MLTSHLGGMSLGKCMRAHTYRQYLVWIAWLDEEWNHPDRNDTYLMQVAAEVRRTLVKKPQDIDLKDFKIRFKTQVQSSSSSTSQLQSGFESQLPAENPLSIESQRIALAKGRSLARMTMPVVHVVIQPEELDTLASVTTRETEDSNG